MKCFNPLSGLGVNLFQKISNLNLDSVYKIHKCFLNHENVISDRFHVRVKTSSNVTTKKILFSKIFCRQMVKTYLIKKYLNFQQKTLSQSAMTIASTENGAQRVKY